MSVTDGESEKIMEGTLEGSTVFSNEMEVQEFLKQPDGEVGSIPPSVGNQSCPPAAAEPLAPFAPGKSEQTQVNRQDKTLPISPAPSPAIKDDEKLSSVGEGALENRNSLSEELSQAELDSYQSEMQEIITAPPSWLFRWGMFVLFTILLLILGASAVIKYPDIVRTELKVSSVDAPKPVVARISGKLVKLLVLDNQMVKKGDALAFLESTGDHKRVLTALTQLKQVRNSLLINDVSLLTASYLNDPALVELGELQSSYQTFYQSYLTYIAAVSNGFYLKKKRYFQDDLKNILRQRQNLQAQRQLHLKEYELAKQEYEMHKHLYEQKVEARMELKREEAKLLASALPLQQTEAALVNNEISYSAKEKEITELNNQIDVAKSSFLQALNNQISEIENWKSKYVLSASQSGKVTFLSILQENQFVSNNQEVFYINPGNTNFFGVIYIPQYNIGKVRRGQEVLIKLKGFPYEEFGILRGKLASVADIPYKDSVFISRVTFQFKASNLRKPIHLKNGMTADAEIITERVSFLNRLFRNLIKGIE